MSPQFKHILRQILPPYVLTVARRLRDLTRKPPQPQWSAPAPEASPAPPPAAPPPSTPASIIQAIIKPEPPEWEAVPDTDEVWTAHEGWSHQSIADAQRERWPAFVASTESRRPFGWRETKPGEPIDVSTHNTIITFGHVLGCAANGHKRLSILDWGGGVGHYYLYARKLRPDLELDYVVKDLPSLCRVGQELQPEVKFVSDEASALSRRYDLVFASSSVQYTRDFYGLLGRLCDAAGGWLMITRSPFVEKHDDFVVVQRPYKYGYMTEYPCWFINRSRFFAFVEARGFVLEREFMLGERPFVANAPEPCVYSSFLFKRAGM